jgi:hypothetical protein
MPSSGMLLRVVPVRTEVSEEFIASIIRAEGISEPRRLAVTCTLLVNVKIVPIVMILLTLIMVNIWSSGTSVLTRATLSHIQEVSILHSHRRENPKS